MKTFCSLPWIHLATHPAGHVSLCCEADHTNLKSSARTDNKLLNIKQNTIDEIMNSDYFKEVRLQMLNDEMPEACTRCFMKEENNLESKRTYENGRYPDVTKDAMADITSADGSIDSKRIQFAELRLGNICNAQCRTCNPGSSSKWIKDYNKLEENLIFMTSYKGTPEFKWPRKQEFWDELLKNDELKTIYINGGEPMLIKQHWQFIQRLVEEDKAKNITLEYSINMTVLPDDAVEIWKKFKHVRLLVSIDDLGERNTYIRNPTVWDDVIDNLNTLMDTCVEILVLQTVSVMNFYYIDEFYKWATDQQLQVIHNFVFDPDFLSPATLPLDLRQEVIDSLTHVSDKQIDAIRELFYYNASNVNHMSQFVEYTEKLDHLRGEDFASVFPELSCRI